MFSYRKSLKRVFKKKGGGRERSDPDRIWVCPSIQLVSADLKAGRVTADVASVGTWEGDVRCDEDNMYVGYNPRVRCVRVETQMALQSRSIQKHFIHPTLGNLHYDGLMKEINKNGQ